MLVLWYQVECEICPSKGFVWMLVCATEKTKHYFDSLTETSEKITQN